MKCTGKRIAREEQFRHCPSTWSTVTTAKFASIILRFVYSGGGRLSFACVCPEHSQCCFIARRNAVDPKWCYLSVCVAVTYVGQQLCHCVWAASGGVFLHCLAYSVVRDVASRPRFSRRGYAVSVYARVRANHMISLCACAGVNTQNAHLHTRTHTYVCKKSGHDPTAS